MSSPKNSLTIFNLNCWLFPSPLSVDCDIRLDKIIALIKERDPDVITLQEVWSNKFLRRIKRRLSGYHAVSSATPFYNQSGLVTLAKQRPLYSRVSFFEMSWRHNATEWFLRKGYCVVGIKLGDHAVNVVNTHLYAPFSKLAEDIPKGQFKEAARSVSGGNAILCGDLNMSEEAFEEANDGMFSRLCNSDITSADVNPYCHQRFNNLMSHEDKKLDYILLKGGLRAKAEYQVVKDPFVSDHYPLFCRLRLAAS